MVLVTGNHLLDELLAHDGGVCPVPSAQFALYIETERVARLQELRVCRIVAQSHGVHVHALDEFHVLYVLRLAQGSARLGTEAMAVYALEDYLLPVDVHAVAGTVLYRTETELLPFFMQGLSVGILQRKHRSIEIRRLGSPLLGVLCREVYPSLVAVACVSHVRSNDLALRIEYLCLHLCPLYGPVEIAVGHEVSVRLGINRHACNVLRRLCHDEYRTEDAAEVPVVGTSFCHVHLTVLALLAHLHLKAVLVVAEEDAVADIKTETIETALVLAAASLTAIDGHLGIGHHRLEDKFYLFAFPLLGQGELVLVASLLVCNALGCRFAVKAHAVLVCAEALQFPAGRHAYFGPFA